VYIYIFQNGIYGSCRLIFTRNLCKNYSICILKCLVIFTANSVLKICTKIQVTVPLSFYLVIFNKNCIKARMCNFYCDFRCNCLLINVNKLQGYECSDDITYIQNTHQELSQPETSGGLGGK
jgi:hypothetical protein